MAKWLLLLLALIPRPSLGGEGVDVKDWLSRPGVKLLAVEFYASWCGPCKKAVPQWKTLHEKYRDQGLRLVVVSVQDPDGSCVNPGWNPDDVVCDNEGHLAKAWGVDDRLPASFLWSWRGTLLVRKGGHVDAVERAIEEELRRLPRVTLDSQLDSGIRELLRTELARTGKVDVVAGAAEEEALAAIRRKSHELQFSDRSACELGQRLAANSLVKASFVAAGNGKRLLVQLFSAETGCLNASAGVFWNEQRPDLSAAEAVTELVNNLRQGVETPNGASVTAHVPAPEVPAPEPLDKVVRYQGTITVTTDPAGAQVLLDGTPIGTTPVAPRSIPAREYEIRILADGFTPIVESVTVERGADTRIDRTLRAVKPLPRIQEGEIRIKALDRQGDALEALVVLDGRKVGMTPHVGKVLVGNHRVQVVLDGVSWEKNVTVRENQTEQFEALLDIGGAASVPATESTAPKNRRRLVHMGLSLAEGIMFAGDTTARSGITATLSTWLEWGWFRWEPVSVGVSFEGANAVTLGTGAAWKVIAGFYFRTMFDVAIAGGRTYWGLLGGAGYVFELGSGWSLSAEVDATFWPGDALGVPLEARVGVGYGF
ncbi:MAG: PEGA domain-containing protein [Pseudomonadota bacterium]